MQRSTMAQAESTRYKPFGGIAVRRACHSVVRFSMADGTKGCEVVSRSRQHTQMATLWSRSSTLNMQDMTKRDQPEGAQEDSPGHHPRDG